jgi:outer membrane protein
MKHMLKKITITALFLFIPIVVMGQMKVGVMSPQMVLDALPETADRQAELQTFINDKRIEFTEKYSEWIDAVNTFEEQVQSNLLNDQARQREEERLAEMEEELGNLENRIQNEIDRKRAELLNPILQRIDNAMREVADEMGLDFVINKETGIGDPIVYFTSQRGVDITQRVIQKLTSN